MFMEGLGMRGSLHVALPAFSGIVFSRALAAQVQAVTSINIWEGIRSAPDLTSAHSAGDMDLTSN